MTAKPKLRRSGPSGKSKPHASRAKGGTVRLEVYLTPAAADALARLVRVHGTKRAAVEAAILDAAARVTRRAVTGPAAAKP